MTTLRRLLIALIASVLLLAAPQAVGTVTVTVASLGNGRVVKYTMAWVSDASGNVSANTSALSVVRPGYLQQVKFIPDGGGTAPTDLYDITLNDANAVDVLAGTGANLSGTLAKITRVAAPIYLDGTANMALDLVVANAGNAKGGTVVLWVSATAD